MRTIRSLGAVRAVASTVVMAIGTVAAISTGTVRAPMMIVSTIIGSVIVGVGARDRMGSGGTIGRTIGIMTTLTMRVGRLDRGRCRGLLNRAI
jgi:hypothetical protein